ncbi:hypothetical protein BJV77DRAFT_85303 [Russula vinacea]|nr:hypothetical protein BJV77DRAFT_85303 [Russula vinacea]
MCFANAVLQLLVHSPPLWNLFRQLGDLKELHGEGGPVTGGGATPLVDATVRFFEEFMNKEEPPPPRQAADGKPREGGEAKKESNVVDSFEPTYIYDAMKEKRKLKGLLDDQKRDAEEFFRLYLDALDEELIQELITLLASSSGHDSATAASGVGERGVSHSGQTEVVTRNFTAESAESPLMRIFGGKFRSTVRSPNQPDSVTIEDWRSLQLDIQHDSVYAIENAVARISHLQPVQLGPSGVGEGSQQVLIETFPPVLVLHLKRFLYDAAADCIVKISKPVRFAPELEIPLETMASVSGKSADAARYKLYGVLYHHGESADSGQYTVDVLHPNEDSSGGDGWLHIDDEAIRVVRPEDVFGVHDNEQVDDRCAYMLFYCVLLLLGRDGLLSFTLRLSWTFSFYHMVSLCSLLWYPL